MKSHARLIALSAFLAPMVGLAQGTSGTVLDLSNIRLNLTGRMLADLTLKQGPPPTGSYADIEFSYPFGGTTVTETVRTMVGSYNVRKAVSSNGAFPCNATVDVTVKVKNPATAPASATTSVTRHCTVTTGTPDLTVAEVVRADVGGGLQSPKETPIRLRVTIANIGYGMPFNEQGGTPWTVQVTPGASGSPDGGTGGVQKFALPLSANQRFTLDVYPVALSCGKMNPVTVVVDRDRVITESNENNNTLTVNIPGNKCQDSE